MNSRRQQIAHFFEQTILAVGGKFRLQFIGFVEMIFDGTFAAAGNKNHLGNAGRRRLFHRILNQRLVHHRQHFFRR